MSWGHSFIVRACEAAAVAISGIASPFAVRQETSGARLGQRWSI
jgi:hypothetical protein